ncbi:unnamed protein product, partial [Hydatigera taeniaeformis]|uniref:Fibronectin type-III domain-containing protein n=1 Tax=Hydatigena taeniaeformis TaxID=6205 RepID=A0A0R3WXT9_HYDTA
MQQLFWLIFFAFFVALGSGITIGMTLPQHFRWSRVGPRSIQLSWDDHKIRGLSIHFINLIVSSLDTKVPQFSGDVEFSDGSVVVDGLQPDTVYLVRLSAYAGGMEVLDHLSTIKTLKDESVTTRGMTLPQHFGWSRVGSRSIQLSWDDHKIRGFSLHFINLIVQKKGATAPQFSEMVEFSDGSVTVDGLQPDTMYDVRLSAYAGSMEVLDHISIFKTLKD